MHGEREIIQHLTAADTPPEASPDVAANGSASAHVRRVSIGGGAVAGGGAPAAAGAPRDQRLGTAMDLYRVAAGLDAPLGLIETGEPATLHPGVTRWLRADLEPDELPHSFALADPALAHAPGEPGADGGPAVRFGRCRDARHLVEVDVEPGTTLHGLGMQAAGLHRADRRYTCWNVDWPAYNADNPGLYQSHPWVFAVRADGSAWGLLVDTTWRCEIDLIDPAAIRVRADGEPPAAYILDARSPADLCALLARLTGPTPMYPRWSLGYHQCRWSYYPAGRALRIAQEFRDRSIPCDVLWFDIHYMKDHRVFTFDETRFPDPASLNERLHQMGFRTVWMIDPAPGKIEDDPTYASGAAGDHFVLGSDGEPYVGSVWAGPSCFPDFTRPETRRWWAGLYAPFLDRGVDGVWNDMNEPSVFDEPAKTIPETCWHRGGGDLPAGPHAKYHNVYGMLMVRASRTGMLDARPHRRPFVLTRSNYIGGHRYAATWTGDNAATWEDLARSIPMVVSLSLSGQHVSGPDIGGFIDRTEGDPELFARWMGIGCLLPFARAHAERDIIDKEPWSFGPECEATCRRAIERRYRLLPYLYTLLWRSYADGAPIVAPVFFADPADGRLRGEDRAFLLGEDVLAVCDVDPPDRAAHRPGSPHALPRGDWRPFELGEPDASLPALHIRGGAALPTGPVAQHTGQLGPDAPLTIIAAPDEHRRAVGWLYEDDGDGDGYTRGGYRLSRIIVEHDPRAAGGWSAALEHADGERPPSPRRDVSVRIIHR